MTDSWSLGSTLGLVNRGRSCSTTWCRAKPEARAATQTEQERERFGEGERGTQRDKGEDMRECVTVRCHVTCVACVGVCSVLVLVLDSRLSLIQAERVLAIIQDSSQASGLWVALEDTRISVRVRVSKPPIDEKLS